MNAPTAPSPVLRRPAAWRVWLGRLAWVAIAVYLWSVRDQVGARLDEVSGTALLGMIGVGLVLNAVNGLGLTFIVRHAGPTVGFPYGVKLYAVGRVMGLLVPGGGSLYRGYRLRQDHGLTLPALASVLLGHIWLSLVMTLGWATILLTVVPLPDGVQGGRFRLLVAVLALGAVTAPLLLRAMRSWSLFQRFSRIGAFQEAMVQLMHAKPLLLKFLVLGTINFGLYLLFLRLGIVGVGEAAPWGAVCLYAVLLRVSTYVNLVPGNVGLLEGLSLVLAKLLHMAPETGVLLMLTIRAADTLSFCLTAAVTGLQDVLSYRTLREGAS